MSGSAARRPSTSSSRDDLDCPDRTRARHQGREDAPTSALHAGRRLRFHHHASPMSAMRPITARSCSTRSRCPASDCRLSARTRPGSARPMASPMSCTHPATTLNPGESIELKLGFAAGPGWDAALHPELRRVQLPGQRQGAVRQSQANDRACAAIPNCLPGRDRELRGPGGEEGRPRHHQEARVTVCSPDGVCSFVDQRRQHRHRDHQRAADRRRLISDRRAGLVDFGSDPALGCVPDSAGQIPLRPSGRRPPAGRLRSRLASGPSSRDGFLGDHARNCAEVRPLPGRANSPTTGPAPTRASRRDPGQADAPHRQDLRGRSRAAVIACRITVSNSAMRPRSGPVRVNDAATILGAGTPVQIQTVTPDGAEWNCGRFRPTTLTCQIPGELLAPGTSRHFDVTVQRSPNQRFENCARGPTDLLRETTSSIRSAKPAQRAGSDDPRREDR